MPSVKAVFSKKGLLSKTVKGFTYRHQQAEMAETIEKIIKKGDVLISEAGTGTGKTFSYLVPALLSGLKVIVSTGTKNLQDQLFQSDLPLIKKALSLGTPTALLKGRSNYLCLHRLENTLAESGFVNPILSHQLQQVSSWSGRTQKGDIAELTEIPENAEIWPFVTSNHYNCLGQDCPSIQQCHLLEARKIAQEADLVVVNHHLLCADFTLKNDGFGELLPEADVFIIDEAHQLHDVASNFFGFDITSRQILELIHDSDTEYQIAAGDFPEFIKSKEALEQVRTDLILLFGEQQRRGSWSEIDKDERLQRGLQRLLDQLIAFQVHLKQLEGRSKGLDSCYARCTEMVDKLHRILVKNKDTEDIRWFETYKKSFRLTSTPLNVGNVFQEQMEARQATWIFTSATLAVDGHFDHFKQQLGIVKADTALWDSPFDYQKQALWFAPRGLPNPNDEHYNQAVSDLAIPIVKASQGRAFLLYTSYRALNEAARYLQNQFDFPLFIQGEKPKAALLAEFKAAGNGVLLGTASFWEGVDVRGEALSCVIIDKLPFASPGDPVLQARIDLLKRNGGNPFLEYQLPQAIIALKQGAGRLIRDHYDRGTLTICDPRLLGRAYGHKILASMPDFNRTRVLEDVIAFFEQK